MSTTYFMISVDNFYWIIFENLLRPTGLDCWYYYPWGTKQNLSKTEFKSLDYRNDYNHVLFHFDQEPLWSDQLGSYDHQVTAWTSKSVKMLANSEHSLLKSQICRSRGMLDWYFFYHGFAALDWYRDAAHINHEYPLKNAFLSMNHLLHGRSYRLNILARLLELGITDKGSISFHTTMRQVCEELSDPGTSLSQGSRDAIERNLHYLSDLPWQLDNVPIDGNLSARFGHAQYKLWQNSLWHLVNETVFYEPKLHLTEKVFKPIVSKRPFILVAAPGNLEYLRGYGFQTFSRWIDESYDSIMDPDQRLDAITHEISKFARMNAGELRDIHQDMLPVLEHNKQHFFGQFRDIIVQELLDNFDQCIRVWNNGRVDGRDIPRHHDLETVKHILLGQGHL